MARYEYECKNCEEVQVLDTHPKALAQCECGEELRLRSVDSSYKWECSECGGPVDKMNDYCSHKCFETGMR